MSSHNEVMVSLARPDCLQPFFELLAVVSTRQPKDEVNYPKKRLLSLQLLYLFDVV